MLFHPVCVLPSQPKQIQDIKDFLVAARRKDAKCECPAVLPFGACNTLHGGEMYRERIVQCCGVQGLHAKGCCGGHCCSRSRKGDACDSVCCTSTESSFSTA